MTVLKAADLTSALAATGSLAVLAPRSSAFARFPAGSANDPVKPADTEKLTAVLKLHGVAGKKMASEYTGKTSDAATPGDAMVHASG